MHAENESTHNHQSRWFRIKSWMRIIERFDHVSIRMKLAIGFSIVIFMVTLVEMVQLYSFISIRDVTNESLAQGETIQQLAAEIQAQADEFISPTEIEGAFENTYAREQSIDSLVDNHKMRHQAIELVLSQLDAKIPDGYYLQDDGGETFTYGSAIKNSLDEHGVAFNGLLEKLLEIKENPNMGATLSMSVNSMITMSIDAGGNNDLLLEVLELEEVEHDYFNNRSPETLAEIKRQLDEIVILINSIDHPQKADLIAETETFWSAMVSIDRINSEISVQQQLYRESDAELRLLINELRQVGLSLVEDRWQEVNQALGQSLYLIVTLIIILILLVAILIVIISRHIVMPLQTMTETAAEFGRGNLTQRVVGINHRNEIGQLANSFNFMADQLSGMVDNLESRIAERTMQLDTLAEISSQLLALRDPKDLLPMISETILTRLDFAFVGIYLIDETRRGLYLDASAGEFLSLNKRSSPAKHAGYVFDLAKDSELLIPQAFIGQKLQHRRDLIQMDGGRFYETHVAIPLSTKQRKLGVLAVRHVGVPVLDQSDIQGIQSLAVQISTSLDNARLYEKSQTFAQDMALARRDAEQASQAKSRFLSSMSHELRTPLNAILGFSQIMVRDPNVQEEHRRHLELILHSGEHLLGLIEDVLEMAKMEAGRAQLQTEPFDLLYMLTTTQAMFSLQAQEKELDLNYEVGSDLPGFVAADQGKLKQILINLIGNALKFTEDGHVIVRCRFELETAERGRIYFEIEDSGIGLAEDEAEKVFDAFVQTTGGQRLQSGTGLGLAISKQMVEMMGGQLSLKSKIGQGTVFFFDVPVGTVLEPDFSGAGTSTEVVGIQAPEGPGQSEYRVLVVDDRTELRVLMREWLTAVGFTVKEAANGKIATEVWEEWRPQLVWMDINMPVMDGIEACQKIKAHPDGESCVVVALITDDMDQQMVYDTSQCDDIMCKPLKEAAVFAKISEHLDLTYRTRNIVKTPKRNAPTIKRKANIIEAELAQIPDELLMSLRDACEEADAQEAQMIIAKIRSEKPELADQLSKLTAAYRFDQLYNSIATALEENTWTPKAHQNQLF